MDEKNIIFVTRNADELIETISDLMKTLEKMMKLLDDASIGKKV